MCAWRAFTILRYGILIAFLKPERLSLIQIEIFSWCLDSPQHLAF